MTLTFCSDLTAADWIARSDLPWQRLVTFGPGGFDAYARLRLLPDPEHPGQSENDVEAEDWRGEQLPRLFETLAGYTTVPGDCYFLVWEGFGGGDPGTGLAEAVPRPDAVPGLAPARPTPGRPTPGRPKVVVPHREYWLFRGPLAEVGAWGMPESLPDETAPAFVWPADHAWCVALDVDPHWAGIGGRELLVERLTTDPRLDVVRADPAASPPAYQ
ncbi:hypothetical protein ACQP2F_22075 [Actinoplanes sp. CA-030573]|uniref:hypothetical protein n=1 Tax=Actinoplanes sp. CA-030573 TaxID=3239898 RepID=UPI003D94F503